MNSILASGLMDVSFPEIRAKYQYQLEKLTDICNEFNIFEDVGGDIGLYRLALEAGGDYLNERNLNSYKVNELFITY